jgi:hypothetical protein
MLVTKKESSETRAQTAARPVATTIETIPRRSGNPDATSAPSTTSRITSAAATPIVSPRTRSSSEIELNVSFRLIDPTGSTSTSAVAEAVILSRNALSSPPSGSSVNFVVTGISAECRSLEISRRSARRQLEVADHGGRLDLLGHRPERVRGVGHHVLERLVVDRQRLRRDDDGLVEGRPAHPLLDQVETRLRIGVGEDAGVGRDVVAEAGGGEAAQRQDDHPGDDRLPWVA